MICDGSDAVSFTSLLDDDELETIFNVLYTAALRRGGVYPDIANNNELFIGFYSE